MRVLPSCSIPNSDRRNSHRPTHRTTKLTAKLSLCAARVSEPKHTVPSRRGQDRGRPGQPEGNCRVSVSTATLRACYGDHATTAPLTSRTALTQAELLEPAVGVSGPRLPWRLHPANPWTRRGPFRFARCATDLTRHRSLLLTCSNAGGWCLFHELPHPGTQSAPADSKAKSVPDYR